VSIPAGKPVPRFSLRDQHGAEVAVGGEAEDGRATLLVFYPFAFSGVCGSELAALRDAGAEFDGEQVRLVAVSCDPMHSLRGYADQEGFGFPLLSDFWPHGSAARAYGVFDEARGCAGRGSFLIDRDGVLRWSLVNPISEARPLEAYREALANAGV
jgi:peroxiredoxin (alkyl hydroperoxide reductase subunit C)